MTNEETYRLIIFSEKIRVEIITPTQLPVETIIKMEKI